MRLDLPSMARRAGRRRSTALRVIEPTKAQEDDLFRLYVRIPREVALFVKARLLPAYQRTLAQTQDSLIRDDIPEIEAQLDDLEEELRRLVLRLTPLLRDFTLRTERWHRGKFIGAVLTATNIALDVFIGPEDARETMAASLARQVDLITDLAREAKQKTADTIWRGFQARRAAREVAKEIQEAMEISRARAKRIAAHQLQVLSSTLDRERQRAAGIEDFRWVHSRKKNGRAEHIARDGKIYAWAKPPDDLPGELPNCGCKAAAWLRIEG